MGGVVLKLSPEDGDAYEAKLFLLLQSEQYSSALSLILDRSSAASPKSGKEVGEYEYERAYSLYRLHSEDKAVHVLDEIRKADANLGGGGSGEVDRGVLHLSAQVVRPFLFFL